MVIFQSEADLLDVIATHDSLVKQCVSGQLTFLSFCDQYKDFYAYYALDGHESDDEERTLLLKYDHLIEPHRVIAYDILGRVCSDADALLDSYKQSGRFGSDEAVKRLRDVSFNA